MIGIIKGDVRYTYLSQIIDDNILSNQLQDFYNIDSLILPFQGVNSDLIIKGTDINVLDIIRNNSIKSIITGNANKELATICKQYNIKLFEMLKDNRFVSENAMLTAKGLLYLIHQKDIELSDLSILILGYGNISYHLAKLLRVLNADFEIYSENSMEEKFIILEGYKYISSVDKDYDIVINTIPSNIKLDFNRLKKSRVIDVASPPYGFNIDDIIKNNINYEVISAIPTKFASLSAAKIIKKFLENIENK